MFINDKIVPKAILIHKSLKGIYVICLKNRFLFMYILLAEYNKFPDVPDIIYLIPTKYCILTFRFNNNWIDGAIIKKRTLKVFCLVGYCGLLIYS